MTLLFEAVDSISACIKAFTTCLLALLVTSVFVMLTHMLEDKILVMCLLCSLDAKHRHGLLRLVVA